MTLLNADRTNLIFCVISELITRSIRCIYKANDSQFISLKHNSGLAQSFPTLHPQRDSRVLENCTAAISTNANANFDLNTLLQ